MPPGGLRTHSTHYTPSLTHLEPLVGAHPRLLLWDDASPVAVADSVSATRRDGEEFPPTSTGRHMDDTVKHARRAQLRKR